MTIDSQLLAGRIADFQAQLAKMVPSEVLAALTREIEAMLRQHPGVAALRAGARVPAFTLPNTRGEDVVLAKLLTKGPVVIAFYRGAWCPYCDLQLRAYRQVLGQIHDLGASLIAISPQTPDYSLITADKAGLEFPVLSDVDNTVARSFGLVFSIAEGMASVLRDLGIELQTFNGKGHPELPVPATFIVAPDHTVAYAYVEADFRQRLEPAHLLEKLAQLARASS